MFTYVSLKNYKSLINFQVDLTSNKKTPKKFVLVYGENGIGKSNFANCFCTLYDFIMTKTYGKQLQSFIENQKDGIKESKVSKNKILEFFTNYYTSTETIIKNSKTIESESNMVLEFGFKYKGKNGVYYIETDNDSIVYEKLDYVYNKNTTTFFNINKDSIELNSKIFYDNRYCLELKDLIEKYQGKHSLLSIIVDERDDKSKGYVAKRISKSLFNVLDHFLSMAIKVNYTNCIEKGHVEQNRYLLQHLEKGIISKDEIVTLNKTQEILNKFFCSLYSDVKQVFYNQELDNDKIKYCLYFKKQIYNEIKDVPYEYESTGTINIIEAFPFLLNAINGNTVIIDEFDCGIHDLLVSQILDNIYDYINGQLIITTHNTILLENQKFQRDVYVFNVNANSEKELLPISYFEERFHPNLNIRKRYFKGLYGGIPYSMDLDFNELNDIIK